MIGKINKIIPMSVVDGPGNRTAIFMQGCQFNCRYCHNPETINHCISCGVCVPECPVGALSFEANKVYWDPDKCIHCDHCIEICPHGSSPKILHWTPKQTVGEIAKNKPFIQGITFSGGECTLQSEFITEVAKLAHKENLDVLADTNGSVDLSLEKYKSLVDTCDGFMVDVKAWDEEQHQNLTGHSGKMVKKNLLFLAEKGKLSEVRTVCLEDADNAAIIRGLATHLDSYLKEGPIPYKLISYRPFGVRKEFKEDSAPSEEEMIQLKELAISLGFGPVILI